MEFLGDLGIDIKLLIAQMINFGLLVWLLTKFFYKPLIRRIEQDEAVLRRAQSQKQEIEREKTLLEDRKQKELRAVKKRARDIIKETEKISQTIKKDAYAKAEADALLLARKTKKKLALLQREMEEAMLKKAHANVRRAFRKSFADSFSAATQKKIQEVLWEDFMHHVKSVTLQKVTTPKLDAGSRTGQKKELLQKAVMRKIGPVTLEYAYAVSARQEKELTDIISKKIGFPITLTKKRNARLINGFRLEVGGIIVENNLLNVINHAKDVQK